MDRRDAIVVNAITGHPVLEVDPVDLAHTGDVALSTDPNILAIWVASEEIMADTVDTVSTSVVWYDTRTPVKVKCIGCDRIIRLDDAVPHEVPDARHLVTCSRCAD